jgi:beta-phosphoglucomutase-like phosphatase (HAD superfamily)
VPDPYLRAFALLDAAGRNQLAASDCVAIEDSRWGLESARAAGLRTVAVTQTYDSSALTGAADLVIESLESLDLAALARLCSR